MRFFASSATNAFGTNPIVNEIEAARNEEIDRKYSKLADSLKYYREYTMRGMNKFRSGDISGAIEDFDRASKSNSSQVTWIVSKK
jgi:hypothetical protein